MTRIPASPRSSTASTGDLSRSSAPSRRACVVQHRRGAAGRHDRGVVLVQRRGCPRAAATAASGPSARPSPAPRRRCRPRPSTACSRSPGSPGRAGTGRARRPGDQRLAGLLLEPGPVGVRLLREPDVLRRVVAVPQDPAGVVAGAAGVAEPEPLQARAPGARGGPAPTRPRCRARRARRRRSRPARSSRGLEPGQQPAADVEAVVLHRREPAVRVGARGHPALHRLADRPVLPVDQVPELGGVASGRSPGAATSSRANSSVQVTSVRSTSSGLTTNAATWSAEAESIRLG